jgi:hypothetical protein
MQDDTSRQENISVDNEVAFSITNKKYDAPIIPKTKLEMWRKIILNGNCEIGGGIFAGSLKIMTGPCLIQQSVFVKDDATVILDGTDRRIVIKGSLQAERSVIFEEAVENSKSYVVVEGDIYSDSINLNRAFVYGNIYAKTAQIKNSVILGAIYAQNNLTISRSIIGTFSSVFASIGEQVTLLLPSAISEKEMILNEDLRVLFFSDIENASKVSGRAFKLSMKDIVGYLPFDGEQKGITPCNIIGAGLRVLNLDKYGDDISRNSSFLAEKYLQNQKMDRDYGSEVAWEESMFETIYNIKDLEIEETFSIDDINLND